MIHLTITKTSFEKIYRNEPDTKTKERMLLVLNVVYNNIIPSQAARDLHRSRAWASDWLKRYDEEGIEGLKDRTKSGRPIGMSEEIIYQIKKELKESNSYGWTTKQVEELIIKKSGIKYHYTHIYRILRKWGFKQKKLPRKVRVDAVAGSQEDKEIFKKRLPRYLWISNKKKKNLR
jgi:putative transposase